MRLGTQVSRVNKSHTEYIYSIFAAEEDEQSISMIAALILSDPFKVRTFERLSLFIVENLVEDSHIVPHGQHKIASSYFKINSGIIGPERIAKEDKHM